MGSRRRHDDRSLAKPCIGVRIQESQDVMLNGPVSQQKGGGSMHRFAISSEVRMVGMLLHDAAQRAADQR